MRGQKWPNAPLTPPFSTPGAETVPPSYLTGRWTSFNMCTFCTSSKKKNFYLKRCHQTVAPLIMSLLLLIVTCEVVNGSFNHNFLFDICLFVQLDNMTTLDKSGDSGRSDELRIAVAFTKFLVELSD